MGATTEVRDLSTTEKVVEFLEDVLDVHDFGYTYGEPGYSDPEGETPLLVLGDFWCRCDGELHDKLGQHYPEEAEVLEDQGVEFLWYDEWVVVHDEDGAVYRTQPDSYSWQPSAILSEDCEWMTPQTSDEEWIEWALNDADRAIPTRMLSSDPTAVDGWHAWPDDDEPETFKNGWYGREDNPHEIAREIREQHPGADVVFVLDSTAQFQVEFSAYFRVPE